MNELFSHNLHIWVDFSSTVKKNFLVLKCAVCVQKVKQSFQGALISNQVLCLTAMMTLANREIRLEI